METLSDKAKVVYAAFDMMGARGSENKTTSYAILDFISETEDLQDHDLLKEVSEQDFVDIIMDMKQRVVFYGFMQKILSSQTKQKLLQQYKINERSVITWIY